MGSPSAPHGCGRVPSPRGGRGMGTSSDTVAVLQGTGTRGSDPRCHPDPSPVPPASPPRCHLYPSVRTVWPLLGSLPGTPPPRGSHCCRTPWVWGLLFGGVAPWQRGSAPSPTMGDPPPYPLLPSTDLPPLRAATTPEHGQALGEGMAGWHGAPGGLVGAPVSLLHPLLYIDPLPSLPPTPLFPF